MYQYYKLSSAAVGKRGVKDLMIRGSLVVFTLITAFVFVISTTVSASANMSSYTLVSEHYSGSGQGGNAATGFSAGDTSLLSQDGSTAVFISDATDLVDNDTNGERDIFYRKVDGGATARANVSSGGAVGDGTELLRGVSATGRYIIYESDATNLEAGSNPYSQYYEYIHDTLTGSNEVITHPTREANYVSVEAVSDDGRFIAATTRGGVFTDGGAHISHDRVSLYDRELDTWTRLDLPLAGTGGEQNKRNWQPKMSCDGAFVVFETAANNLTDETDSSRSFQDIILVDLRNGIKLQNITYQSNGYSYYPNISCGGRYITYESTATNIATTTSGVTPGGTERHFYVYDRINGTHDMVSQTTSGNILYRDGGIGDTHITPTDNGRVYFSARTGLCACDQTKPYVRGLADDTTTAVEDGSLSLVPKWGPRRVDSQGSVILFTSDRTDLVATDTNGIYDLYTAKLD